VKAEESSLFYLLKGVVRLYPADFRGRFTDEILQTCRDQLHDQTVGKAGFWLATFPDLFTSILHEWIGEVRSGMRLSNVFKGIGSLLIGLWFAAFLLITGVGLLAWMFSDPMRLALDHAFSNTLVQSLGTGLMTMGPFIAFLAFLIPQLRVHTDGAERSLEIKMLPMARHSAQMLLLSGLLSLVLFVIYIVARL